MKGGCDALLRVVDDLVVALAPLTFKAPVAYMYVPGSCVSPLSVSFNAFAFSIC